MGSAAHVWARAVRIMSLIRPDTLAKGSSPFVALNRMAAAMLKAAKTQSPQTGLASSRIDDRSRIARRCRFQHPPDPCCGLEPGEAPNVAPWKGAGIGDVSPTRTRSAGDSA